MTVSFQTLLYDLSSNGVMGALGKLLETDRTFFYNTLVEGQNYRDVIENIVREKLETFAQGSKTEADKERIRSEIRNAIRGIQRVNYTL